VAGAEGVQGVRDAEDGGPGLAPSIFPLPGGENLCDREEVLASSSSSSSWQNWSASAPLLPLRAQFQLHWLLAAPPLESWLAIGAMRGSASLVGILPSRARGALCRAAEDQESTPPYD